MVDLFFFLPFFHKLTCVNTLDATEPEVLKFYERSRILEIIYYYIVFEIAECEVHKKWPYILYSSYKTKFVTRQTETD